LTIGALVALPASAADLHVANSTALVVRITLTNKAADQLSKEIDAAARLVCADAAAGADCVAEVRDDANRQVRELTARIHPSAPGKIEVARNDPTSVRILLQGKSVAQVSQEIEAAAATVCKGSAGADFRDCVADAIRDAKGRLAEAQKVGARG
jgi:hypothetical protein